MHTIRKTHEKITRRLRLVEPLAYRRKLPLAPLEYQPLAAPGDFPQDDDAVTGAVIGASWQPVPQDTYWGGAGLSFALRGEFHVPADFDPRSPAALLLRLGDGGDFSHPEALLYIDGEAYAAIDRHHQEVQLAARHRDGQPHTLLLLGWSGLLGGLPSPPGRQLFMGECAVAEIYQPGRDFVALARTALQAAALLDELEPARTRLLNALDEAFLRLDTRHPLGESFYLSLPAALEALRGGIQSAGAPLDVDLIAAGHAHIDVAWLWTLDQTRQKARRTFHTALRLMEQFPAYHFSQSQPQLYEFVRQDDPALFAEIKRRVVEDRWEPLGGMWVEADCNLSGAESLARQLLLGRAFFREHFGQQAESPVLWLPDVFGYAWNLPQLIRQAGLEYFFTIKIGWNQYNPMPYDSFWWQGLDGTRVLTHFSTSPETPAQPGPADMRNTATYNADLSAFTALGSWARLKQKEDQRTLLMSYGYGDGGGGPTREMNENALALQAFPGFPG